MLILSAFAPFAHATTSLSYQYDTNGNLISGDGKYYEYNDANQLAKVRHGDQNGPVIAEYVYDHTGQACYGYWGQSGIKSRWKR